MERALLLVPCELKSTYIDVIKSLYKGALCQNRDIRIAIINSHKNIFNGLPYVMIDSEFNKAKSSIFFIPKLFLQFYFLYKFLSQTISLKDYTVVIPFGVPCYYALIPKILKFKVVVLSIHECNSKKSFLNTISYMLSYVLKIRRINFNDKSVSSLIKSNNYYFNIVDFYKYYISIFKDRYSDINSTSIKKDKISVLVPLFAKKSQFYAQGLIRIVSCFPSVNFDFIVRDIEYYKNKFKLPSNVNLYSYNQYSLSSISRDNVLLIPNRLKSFSSSYIPFVANFVAQGKPVILHSRSTICNALDSGVNFFSLKDNWIEDTERFISRFIQYPNIFSRIRTSIFYKEEQSVFLNHLIQKINLV